MKPFVLIVRGPGNWLSYLDVSSKGDSLPEGTKEKMIAEYQAALLRYNHWLRDQETRGFIQISSRLTTDQRIFSSDTEIDFNLLQVIEGAKVMQVIFALADSWENVVDVVKNCPLPNSHFSIEIREVQQAKASVNQ